MNNLLHFQCSFIGKTKNSIASKSENPLPQKIWNHIDLDLNPAADDLVRVWWPNKKIVRIENKNGKLLF